MGVGNGEWGWGEGKGIIESSRTFMKGARTYNEDQPRSSQIMIYIHRKIHSRKIHSKICMHLPSKTADGAGELVDWSVEYLVQFLHPLRRHGGGDIRLRRIFENFDGALPFLGRPETFPRQKSERQMCGRQRISAQY